MSEATLAISLVTTPKGLDARGEGVRVEFQKNGDRFGHTIFAVRDGEATPLLESIEGASTEIAPSSPPFAELHQQGETIFLSGATTLGHWSMSVEAAEGQLLLDVACRVKSVTNNLGSAYRVLGDGYTAEPANGTTTEIAAGTLRVIPTLPPTSDFPATIQWRYTIGPQANLTQNCR